MVSNPETSEIEVHSAPLEVAYDAGTHHRALLGFIIISMDLVMEENIFRLCPEGVGPSVTRLNSANDCNVATLAAQIDGMAEAASSGPKSVAARRVRSRLPWLAA